MNLINESSFINNDELIEKLMKTIGSSTVKISQNGQKVRLNDVSTKKT